MPKLPARSRISSIEKVNQKHLKTGEVLLPTTPRIRKVFQLHLKLSFVALGLILLFGGLFVILKALTMEKIQVPEVVENTAPKEDFDPNQFESYARESFNSPSFENLVELKVDRVDSDNKILFASTFGPHSKKYYVKVVDETVVSRDWGSLPAELAAQESANVPTFAEFREGSVIHVISVEDPESSEYLNAVSILIIV